MIARPPLRTGPRRQRGVALITAVLMVALATMLAVDVSFRGALDQRRSATLFALDQSLEIAGAEPGPPISSARPQSQTDHPKPGRPGRCRSTAARLKAASRTCRDASTSTT
jgi:hypothetical protein